MKRGIVLIVMLLLLIDLGEDGCLGKATFVAPQPSAKISFTSPLVNCSGKIDSCDTLPSDGGEISRLVQCQAVTLLVQPALKIIIYTHTGSSGGIPL
jgi:hypothetical protein